MATQVFECQVTGAEQQWPQSAPDPSVDIEYGVNEIA